MVYGGKPSTGCYLCRKRKIKCDEGRPGCRNCSIYGQPCPGYRPDAVFRDESKRLEQQVKSNLPLISSGSQSPTGFGGYSSEDSAKSMFGITPASSHVSSSLNLIPLADANWQQRAICYFFDQYTINPGSDGVGHMDYLAPLFVQLDLRSGEPSVISLQSAVEATALIAYAKSVGAGPLATQARQGYGQALTSLREALTSPTQVTRDETFATVVILSLFEDISGERNGLHSSHTAGFEYLMKVRGQSQFDRQRGRDMFNYAFAQMHTEILALGEKPRGNLDSVLEALSDTDDPTEQLMLRTAEVIKLYESIQAVPTAPDLATVEQWLKHAQEIDSHIYQWGLTLPERWLPLIVYSTQGEHLIAYHNGAYGVVWNYYRALRVMLHLQIIGINRGLIAILAQMNQHNPTGDPIRSDSQLDEARLQAVIREMTADVCRSIPFLISQVDTFGRPISPGNNTRNVRAAQSFGLLWPLWYILSCGMPNPAQFEQIRSVLYNIGNTQGIHLALVLASKAESIRGDTDQLKTFATFHTA